MMKVYADSNINWEFLYRVLFEDDDIIVLGDMGRWHKYDTDRMYTEKIDKYIELGQEYVRVDGKLKLFQLIP